jgi:hypothetical protein
MLQDYALWRGGSWQGSMWHAAKGGKEEIEIPVAAPG